MSLFIETNAKMPKERENVRIVWVEGGIEVKGGCNREKSLIRHSTSVNPLSPYSQKEQGWEGWAGRDEKFLTRGQRNFGLEHGPLLNPLANPQISPFHCFQEVRSHRPRMQEADLGTLQELQATELDGRVCVHV